MCVISIDVERCSSGRVPLHLSVKYICKWRSARHAHVTVNIEHLQDTLMLQKLNGGLQVYCERHIHHLNK
jgi:hypothetical protein